MKIAGIGFIFGLTIVIGNNSIGIKSSLGNEACKPFAKFKRQSLNPGMENPIPISMPERLRKLLLYNLDTAQHELKRESGEDVNFICDTKHLKTHLLELGSHCVRWLKDGDALKMDPSRMVYRNDILAINDLRPTDTGVYQCRIEFGLDYIVTVTFWALHVRTGEPNLHARHTEELNLHCNSDTLAIILRNIDFSLGKKGPMAHAYGRVAGNPTYVLSTRQWYFNNTISTLIRKSIPNTDPSPETIFPAMYYMSGEWACMVTHTPTQRRWTTAWYRVRIGKEPGKLEVWWIKIKRNKQKVIWIGVSILWVCIFLFIGVARSTQKENERVDREFERLKKMLLQSEMDAIERRKAGDDDLTSESDEHTNEKSARSDSTTSSDTSLTLSQNQSARSGSTVSFDTSLTQSQNQSARSGSIVSFDTSLTQSQNQSARSGPTVSGSTVSSDTSLTQSRRQSARSDPTVSGSTVSSDTSLTQSRNQNARSGSTVSSDTSRTQSQNPSARSGPTVSGSTVSSDTSLSQSQNPSARSGPTVSGSTVSSDTSLTQSQNLSARSVSGSTMSSDTSLTQSARSDSTAISGTNVTHTQNQSYWPESSGNIDTKHSQHQNYWPESSSNIDAKHSQHQSYWPESSGNIDTKHFQDQNQSYWSAASDSIDAEYSQDQHQSYWPDSIETVDRSEDQNQNYRSNSPESVNNNFTAYENQRNWPNFAETFATDYSIAHQHNIRPKSMEKTNINYTQGHH